MGQSRHCRSGPLRRTLFLEEAEMLAVRCPEVTTTRGERLVSERRVTGLTGSPRGWLLRVACPCGHEHVVPVPRLPTYP